MRKFLLASVATLASTGGLLGTAAAQPGPISPITVPPNPPTFSQGQVPTIPSWVGIGANNNNNFQAPMLQGSVANPTPGTIVVHLNGAVIVEAQGTWTSADQHAVSAPTGASGAAPVTITVPAGGFAPGTKITIPNATSSAAILGTNGTGTAKVMPQAIDSYARLYAGVDGMATNGLRYGAAMEVRENFTGQISNNGSSGASGYSSLETLYIRRAFTYVAGDQWGILRVGQADGLISIFDNGVTSFQFTWTGGLNGGDLQNMVSAAPPFVFSNVSGNEYDNTKAVYLSPQIAGFDFGIQYAPNTSNGEGIASTAGGLGNVASTGSGVGTGLSCGPANTGCPTLSSGPGVQDGSRSINQTALGVRYQGVVGGVGVLAYGVWEFSGHANYTGTLAAATAGNPTNAAGAPLGKFTGQYKGLEIGSGGVALTFGGLTVGGNVIGGNMNGQLGLAPQGGAPLLGVLAGADYKIGPLIFGVQAMEYWEQGSVNLSGLTQLRARGIDVAAQYQVAPGFYTFAEYLWNDQQQSARNFITGAVGSGANNNLKGQGVMVGNVIRF